jgi:hypothetical protein
MTKMRQPGKDDTETWRILERWSVDPVRLLVLRLETIVMMMEMKVCIWQLKWLAACVSHGPVGLEETSSPPYAPV